MEHFDNRSSTWGMIVVAVIIAIIGPITVWYVTSSEAKSEQQELKATMIALQSIIEQKEQQPPQQIEIVVTATPTNTPQGPTSTPTLAPPTATPTADPRLFWDDFENGIKPEWGMFGDGFSVVNGQLKTQNGLMESQLVGNTDWYNYVVELNNLTMEDHYIQIRLRMQDRSNYIYVQCNDTTYASRFCKWHRVIDGHDETIAGTDFWAVMHKQFIKIEAQDDIYRIYYNTTNDGFQQMKIVDTNFRSGGIGLFIEAGHTGTSLDGIEIKKLP